MVTTPARRRVTVALAALSAGAGAAHASVIADHVAAAWWYGVGFGVVALAQGAWAVLVLRRPSRRLLAWGAVGHGLVLVAWVLARTAGLPFVPGESPTAVGVLDGTTALFQGLIVLGVLVSTSAAVRMRPRLERAVGVSAAVVVLLTAPVTVAALAAGPGHTHDAPHSHASDEPHEH